MDTVNVTKPDQPVFIFRAQEYRLDALKTQLPHAPLVEISATDIHPAGVGNGPYQVQFSAAVMDSPGEQVAFYRHEGKFAVLLGHQSVHERLAKGDTHLRGRIISTPALKRARIDASVVEAPAQPAFEPVTLPAQPPHHPPRTRNTELTRSSQRRAYPAVATRNAAGEHAHAGAPRFLKGG